MTRTDSSNWSQVKVIFIMLKSIIVTAFASPSWWYFKVLLSVKKGGKWKN